MRLSRALRSTLLLFGAMLSLGSVLPAVAAAGEDAPVTPRIIGGTRAPDYPFLVRLHVSSAATGMTDQFYCGGTLIAPDVILTAAHCTSVKYFRSNIDVDRIVAFPATDLTSVDAQLAKGASAESLGGVRVKSMVRHPLNSIDDKTYDVALLYLDHPMPGTPIRLAGAGDAALWAPGQVQTAAGYGQTTDPIADPPPTQSVPLQTTLPIVADSTCAGLSAGFKALTMLCAGAQPKGTCYGDSGGPLMVSTPRGWVQTGVTSWGIAECGKAPSVFARIGADPLRQWIAYELGEHGGAGALPGAPLKVSSTPTGALQAILSGDSQFRPSGGDIGEGGLIVQSLGGTPENYGPAYNGRWPIDRAWTPVSRAATTGDGSASDPYTQVTDYRSAAGAALDLRVRQTLRYTSGRTGFDVSYAITNAGSTAARFAAATVAQPLTTGEDSTDLAVAAPQSSRLLGMSPPTRAFVSGFVEVPGSTPWSSFYAGNEFDLQTQIRTRAALSNQTYSSGYRASVAARWDDHAAAGTALAAGATATYATHWATRAAPPIDIRPWSTDSSGSAAAITVSVQDDLGAPRAGVAIAWQADAATPITGKGTTNAQGAFNFSVPRMPDATYQHVSAWEDRDGDGVQDPDEPMADTSIHFTDVVSRPSEIALSGLPVVPGTLVAPPTVLVTAAQLAAAPSGCVPLTVTVPRARSPARRSPVAAPSSPATTVPSRTRPSNR